jgi:small-conductance mechanosensitive channel
MIINTLDTSEIFTRVALFLPRLLSAVIIFFIFWLLATVLVRIIQRFTLKKHVDPDVSQLIAQTGSIALIVLGIVTALGTLGINMAATIASLGLVGFAVGFALRDTISNVLSGVLILVYKPFHRNDRISVITHEGEVIEINLRYTVLRDQDRTILVPNSTLFNNPVIVLSQHTPMGV